MNEISLNRTKRLLGFLSTKHIWFLQYAVAALLVCSTADGSASGLPLVCWYDANDDGKCDYEDLYELYSAPRDVNGDGVADSQDVRSVERYLRLNEQASVAAGFGLERAIPFLPVVTIDTNPMSSQIAQWNYILDGGELVFELWGRKASNGLPVHADEIRLKQRGMDARLRFDSDGLPLEYDESVSGEHVRWVWSVSVDGSAVGSVVWLDSAGSMQSEPVALPPGSLTSQDKLPAAVSTQGEVERTYCRSISFVNPDGSQLNGLQFKVRVTNSVGDLLYEEFPSNGLGSVGSYRICVPDPCATPVNPILQYRSTSTMIRNACPLVGDILLSVLPGDRYSKLGLHAIAGMACKVYDMDVMLGGDSLGESYIQEIVRERAWNWPDFVNIEVVGLVWPPSGEPVITTLFSEEGVNPCASAPSEPVVIEQESFDNPLVNGENLFVWGLKPRWFGASNSDGNLVFIFQGEFNFATRDYENVYIMGAGASPRKCIAVTVHGTGDGGGTFRSYCVDVNDQFPRFGVSPIIIPSHIQQELFWPGDTVRVSISGTSYELRVPTAAIR